MRAMWVRVRWGAFCVPDCLRAWLSVYPDVDPVVWWSVALCLVAPWERYKKSLFRALVGIFMAFDFCVIYISVKYLIPFCFGNYCGIKF